ncbi:hypothetical protein FACS18949_05470 [Clostridia bacterium]|nr:hypothetical protein FACS18949_05470 [Clostridia bacterium]
MSIIYFLGTSVNDYKAKVKQTIKQMIQADMINCDICHKQMKTYGPYDRSIKDTGEDLPIYMAKCQSKQCNGSKHGHALIPDFILPHKHYSADEIESVMMQNAESISVSKTDTEASESTVRRWIGQVNERARMAISVIRGILIRLMLSISELRIEGSTPFMELSSLLEKHPERPPRCGNILGEANIHLSRERGGVFI